MSATHTGGGGYGSAIVTFDLAPGILIGFDVFTEGDLWKSFATFVTVNVCVGGATYDHRQFNLISGYITQFVPLHWQGFIELPPDATCFCRIRGTLSYNIRFVDHRLERGPKTEVIEIAKQLLSAAGAG